MSSPADPVVARYAPLEPSSSMPRIAGGPRVETGGIVVGEWSLTRAAFTDRHQHVEVNTVLEGELLVSVDDGPATRLGPGDTIAVPAGSRGRYEAPQFARMIYAYGPGEPGMTDIAYEEL